MSWAGRATVVQQRRRCGGETIKARSGARRDIGSGTQFGLGPAGATEVQRRQDAEHPLFRQVWYNRHWNLRSEIEARTHHVVLEHEYSRNPYRNDQTLDTVWAGALTSAKRTEDEVGLENLGPWTDFEWGMFNSKLSALRWLLGDEWDTLDT